VTVGAGGQASISFTSIPSTYTHLQVRATYSTAVADRSIRFTANGDTGSNYSWHYIQGDRSTATAGSVANIQYGIIGIAPNSTSFGGVLVADYLDYANTNKFKTVRSLSGADMNGAGSYVQFWSSLWRSTSAISTITINPSSGNWNQYSTFALYGIKGVA
jgi:hypothetical protein